MRPYNCLSLFIALFTHFTCSSWNAEGGVPYRSLTMKQMRAHTVRPYNCFTLFIALFTHFTCSSWNAEDGVPYRSLPLKKTRVHTVRPTIVYLYSLRYLRILLFIVERRWRRSLQMYHAIINIFSAVERKQINVNVQGKRVYERIVIGVKLPSACRRAQRPTT